MKKLTLHHWIARWGMACMVFMLGCGDDPPRPGSGVEILSPSDGFETNRNEVVVEVAFSADEQDQAPIVLIELHVTTSEGSAVIGSQTNDPANLTGQVDFTVGLDNLPEGATTLRAVAHHTKPETNLPSEDAINILVDRTAPTIQISSPGDSTVAPDAVVSIEGTLSEPGMVMVDGTQAAISGTSFSADVRVRQGTNVVVAEVRDSAGNSSSDNIIVLRDTRPPRISIRSPQANGVLAPGPVSVTGTIEDGQLGAINANDCTVEVNGVPATVENGGFLATAVPLSPGQNTITAVATDRGGNQATDVQVVTAESRPVNILQLVSGDAQSATVGAALSAPLEVRALDSAGQPLAGIPVTFEVLRGDGRFSDETRRMTSMTDGTGSASAQFSVGTRTGVGSNLVGVSADGFATEPAFTAAGTPDTSAALQIAASSGAVQRGGVNAVAPEALGVLVTDQFGNPSAGQAVTFEVTKGNGQVNGAPSFNATTDADGRAVAVWIFGFEEGINSQRVEARLSEEVSIQFVGSTVSVGEPVDTAVSGVVLNNLKQPVADAVITIVGTQLTAVTDVGGRFRIAGAPEGHIHLVIDGEAAGSYPMLEFELTLIVGVENPMQRPVYLPLIDSQGVGVVSPTTDTIITRWDLPGFELFIPAGSARFQDGSYAGEIRVIRVNNTMIPMAPPDGQFAASAIAIKPANVIFDPPARIRMPNLTGRSPGEVATVYSFDHPVGQFVAVATGQVSEDGLFLESEPGQGLIHGGWHITPVEPEITEIESQCVVVRDNCTDADFGPECVGITHCATVEGKGKGDSGCYCGKAKGFGECVKEAVLPVGVQCKRGSAATVEADEDGFCRNPEADVDSNERICCPKNHWCGAMGGGGTCYATSGGCDDANENQPCANGCE